MTTPHVSPRLVALGAAAVLTVGAGACGSGEDEITLGLITKQEENPFFVTMREVAEDVADENDVNLLTAAGKSDVDNASQVRALAEMTRDGAEGIMIVPARSRAIVPAIETAREAGVIVVALDTPTQPRSAVEALYATNNRRAGNLIGRYAKAKAEEDGIEPRIAMLDLAPGISVGELRHEGFLTGFGIDDGDPEIVGSAYAQGDEDNARATMARLLDEDPGINIVYTINEPTAFGAIDALKEAGRDMDDVIIVSIDGSCDAIKNGVRTGEIDATSQQYPENMAREGLEAVAEAVRGGPSPSGFLDTGVELITADPVEGVESEDEAFGVRNCWGD
ncbi:MAG: substrate-binding domain-containing protein [Thermoleophilaceae bacterium]|nr:substrate-binding domain-containing protein [Thermoleophilaceae bacterium]